MSAEEGAVELDLPEVQVFNEGESEQAVEKEKKEIDLSNVPEEDHKYAKGFNPDGEKSIEQYIHDGKFIETISRVNKENKELKSTLNELKVHLNKQKELGYQTALKELREEREAAIALGDIDLVDKVEDQIHKHEKELGPAQSLHPAAEAFVQKHNDIFSDPSYRAQQVREFIENRDQELTKFGLTPEKHIEVLENDLKVKFPERFQKENPSVVSRSVESDSAPVSSKSKKSKFTFSDLNKEQKICYRHFVDSGIMSGEKYIQDLVDQGDLK